MTQGRTQAASCREMVGLTIFQTQLKLTRKHVECVEFGWGIVLMILSNSLTVSPFIAVTKYLR